MNHRTVRNRSGLSTIGTVALVMTALAVVIVLATVLVKAKRKTAKPAEEQPLDVTTVTVVRERLENRLSLPARIEAEYAANVAVPKAGIVREMLADRGMRVDKGMPLLRLDNTLWNALFQRAEIELREAGRELVRMEELRKTGAVSDSAMDGTRARFDMARVGFEESSNNLAKCELRSPAAGIVVDKFVQVGEFAGEGAPVMRIVSTDTVKLKFDVPEREIRWVSEGREAAFTVEPVPGRVFTGTVAFLAAAADPSNNAFPAEVRAVNSEGLLRPGMVARVSIVRRTEENAIRLPLKALVPKKGAYVAFVVENNRAVRRIVTVDEIQGDEVLISAGIGAGDRLVVEGNRSLADGMPVTTGGAASSPGATVTNAPTAERAPVGLKK